MEIKSMGSFIASLRKASGMTQLELAERLNVSSKAVSRWETDVNAPDLSLIPVIAELFGVTCDELIKGEYQEKKNESLSNVQKVEKNIHYLVERIMSQYSIAIYISFAISFIGYLLLLAIAYDFYKTILGITVMIIFVVISVLTNVLSYLRLSTQLKTNVILNQSIQLDLKTFQHKKYQFMFLNLFVNSLVIIWSLPFLLYNKMEINGFIIKTVITFSSYMKLVPVLIIVSYVLYSVGTILMKIFVYKEKITLMNKEVQSLNIGQVLLFIVSIILAAVTSKLHEVNLVFYWISLFITLITILLIPLGIGDQSKKKPHHSHLIIATGFRNIGYFVSILLFTLVYTPSSILLRNGVTDSSFIESSTSDYLVVKVNNTLVNNLSSFFLLMLTLGITITGYKLLMKYWVNGNIDGTLVEA